MIAIIFLSLFLTEEIDLEGKRLKVEIAQTRESRRKGLMWREKIEENEGMLFIFPKPDILSFWMENTFIPLSIAFFDETRTLIEIRDMPVPTSSGKESLLYESSRPAVYALEMPFHWFKKNEIKSGMKFSFLNRSNTVK